MKKCQRRRKFRLPCSKSFWCVNYLQILGNSSPELNIRQKLQSFWYFNGNRSINVRELCNHICNPLPHTASELASRLKSKSNYQNGGWGGGGGEPVPKYAQWGRSSVLSLTAYHRWEAKNSNAQHEPKPSDWARLKLEPNGQASSVFHHLHRQIHQS